MFFNGQALVNNYSNISMKIIKTSFCENLLRLHISLRNVVIKSDPEVNSIIYDQVIDLNTGKTTDIYLDRIGNLEKGLYTAFDIYVFNNDDHIVQSWLDDIYNFCVDFNIPTDFSNCIIYNKTIVDAVNENLNDLFGGKIQLKQIDEEESDTSFRTPLLISNQYDEHNYIRFKYLNHMGTKIFSGLTIKVRLVLCDIEENFTFNYNKNMNLEALFKKTADIFNANITMLSNYSDTVKDFVDICNKYI